MSVAPHDSPRYRALIQLLRTAEDLWNVSRVFFARWNLSPSQFNVLNLLHGHPDGLSQSELSRLLIMHRSNATGLVDRLERRGWVRRLDHAHDRRAYRVVLTQEGAQLLSQIHPHYFQAAEQVWSPLPDSRVTQLLQDLQTITQNAGPIAAHLPATPHPRTRAPHSNPPRSQRRSPKPSRPPLPAAAPAAGAATLPESLRISDL